MAKTRKTKAPAKPKTAYDLCELAAQHIEEEPLRYYQRQWWARGDDLDSMVRWHKLPAAPPCGTTACRAGWIMGLHDGVRSTDRAARAYVIGARARQILGVSGKATAKLFSGSDVIGVPGTVDYAAEGAAGLRRWMRRHAARLKSRLLKDVPKLDTKALTLTEYRSNGEGY